MENGNGLSNSSTTNTSSECSKKASLGGSLRNFRLENGKETLRDVKSSSSEHSKKLPQAGGLRNFRMDRESATKGQATILRFFRSDSKRSLGGNESRETSMKEASDLDSERPTSPVIQTSIPHIKSKDGPGEESSEKSKVNSPIKLLVNKPSSIVSFRQTTSESQAEMERDSSSQSFKTDSDDETICSQQSMETNDNAGTDEPTSPVLKRKGVWDSINGGVAKVTDPQSTRSPLKSSKLLFVKPPSLESADSNSTKEDSSGNPLGGVSMKSLIACSSLKKQFSGIDTDQDSQDSPIFQARTQKRARVIDSDDDDDDDSNPPSKKVLVNGSENSPDPDDDRPDDEAIDKYLDMWVEVYPHVDRMECLDLYKEHNWDVKDTMLHLGRINSFRKSQGKVKLIEDMMARKKALSEKRKEEQMMRKKEALEKKEELKKQREAVRQLESAERAAQREKLKTQKAILKARAAMKNSEQDFEEDEEEYDVVNTNVYESDEDSDVEPDMSMTPDRQLVLNFFNDANVGELAAIQGCNKKKAELIIELRPFSDWSDIVYKFQTQKSITPELLNQARSILHVRKTVQLLMKKCEKIAKDMESIVSRIVSGEEDAGISEQPPSLNQSMQLKSYQLIGLNWLVLMHEQGLNGVLADEMGLGKTVQAISFLAHIKEVDDPEKFSLIVVPSSTLENWARELELWCPSLVVLQYHGTQEERRNIRMGIINDDLDEYPDVILTTYNMVTSCPEDKALFKKLRFNIVILDEAHMLKNMASQRYEQLMKIKGERRVLLTGTPLQNNLVELMSILIFVMPQLFDSKRDELKRVFAMFPKNEESSKTKFENERIEQAKRIMKPFFLRRLKNDVLKDLPTKSDRLIHVPMSANQQKIYSDTVAVLSKRAQQNKIKFEEINLKNLTEIEELEMTAKLSGKGKKEPASEAQDTSSNMVMTLRKITNHPLLIRNHYTLAKLKQMAKILKKTTHRDSVVEYIVDDLSVMSDFQIHKTCQMFRPIKDYCLKDEQILDSGKLQQLDILLPKLKEEGARVLIFSQFVIVLDILEQYVKIRKHKFVRIDGSTQVSDRQMLIDLFTEDESIFLFLLSTRAGGLGINLTAANTVILHDIDFNPYNDKQAEDRCHRVGQTRPVEVIRFVGKDSIEEGMLQIARDKLQLEKDVTGRGEEHHVKGDLVSLLKKALGLGKMESSSSKDVTNNQENQEKDSEEEEDAVSNSEGD